MTGKRLRIAVFSPYDRGASGIADYCHMNLKLISRHFDVTIVPEGGEPEKESLPPGVSIRRFSDLLASDYRKEFDLPVYHLGNSPLHNYLFPLMLAWPGLVAIHDAWIMGTRLQLALKSWRGEAFREEMQLNYGERRGWDAAEIILSGLHDGRFLRYFPMSELAVKASRMAVVHQRWLKQSYETTNADAVVRLVPHLMPTPEPQPSEKLAATREELGIKQDAFLLGMFGGLVPEKRPEESLNAFAWLHKRHPESRLLFVGRCAPEVDLNALIAKAGLEEAVIRAGRVSEADYFTFMQCCDSLLLLRWPTNRETSGVLINGFSLGIPVVTTNLAHFSDYPESTLLRVDVNKEEYDLRQQLLRLAESPALREETGKAAAKHYQTVHAPARVEKRWVELISEAAALPTSPFRRQAELPEHLQLGVC